MLSFATVIDWILVVGGWRVPDYLYVGSALGAMIWWFAIVGNLTAVQRFVQGLRWFNKNPE